MYLSGFWGLQMDDINYCTLLSYLIITHHYILLVLPYMDLVFNVYVKLESGPLFGVQVADMNLYKLLVKNTICRHFKYPLLVLVIMQDFVYPEGVAFPIGGVGNSEYVVLEMHYDNPGLVPGAEYTPNTIIYCYGANIESPNRIRLNLVYTII